MLHTHIFISDATDISGIRLCMAGKRIFMLGATGTIGRATLAALLARGHRVVCFARDGSKPADAAISLPEGTTEWRFGDATDADSLRRDGFRSEHFDVLVSCMASRTGAPDDAWRIDYQAHVDALAAARDVGVAHMVLLSAMCVQKPMLAFQHAKLAFENDLIASGICYSIVRPTAFFKSLSGQAERVRNDKPFLLFGDGALTACKPISDADLGAFLADCVADADKHNRLLPIGGPGDAVTPRQQGEMLFAAFQKPARFRSVPLGFIDFIIASLALAGRMIPAAARKAELARIGRYYATESMLVYDSKQGKYDAALTPSTGTETLTDHYRKLASCERVSDLGEHAIF